VSSHAEVNCRRAGIRVTFSVCVDICQTENTDVRGVFRTKGLGLEQPGKGLMVKKMKIKLEKYNNFFETRHRNFG
jgi:hypothetical protein